MATKRTACEEAADEYDLRAAVSSITQHRQQFEARAKRLRAEGRELMLYRKLARDVSYGTDKRRIAATLALQVMASDIQKEGMKK